MNKFEQEFSDAHQMTLAGAGVGTSIPCLGRGRGGKGRGGGYMFS